MSMLFLSTLLIYIFGLLPSWFIFKWFFSFDKLKHKNKFFATCTLIWPLMIIFIFVGFVMWILERVASSIENKINHMSIDQE